MGTYAVNIYGWLICKLTVPQRTIESKTNMQYIYYTASTQLWKTSHTIMCHDTTIVLEHSFKYRESIYYSLVTPSKSSYLYIDFAIYKWSWICIACSFIMSMLTIINLQYGIVTVRINTALVLVYWFLLPLNT
jgi:hypothetical protein